MNYSSDCIQQTYEFADKLLKENLNADAEKLCFLSSSLKESHKFILPPPYRLNINVDSNALSLMKLPYPITAFEFSYPIVDKDDLKEYQDNYDSQSSKSIALAYDCTKDIWPVNYLKKSGKLSKESTGILVVSFMYHDESKSWTPFPHVGYIDEEIASNVNNFYLDNSKSVINFKTINLLEDLSNKVFNEKTSEMEKKQSIVDNLTMAVRGTLMLNTKNLKVVQAVKAPEKLNKKRIKNNKTPYFDYYTLDIFFSKSGSVVDRKKVNYGAIQEEINSSNLAKRWATVRGHFKIRSTGIFWWSNHARGNKINGIIEKDYSLKPIKKFNI